MEEEDIFLQEPSSTSWTTLIVWVIVLAILGYCIFMYLAKGVNVFDDLFTKMSSFVESIGQLAGKDTKKTEDITKKNIPEEPDDNEQELDKVIEKKKKIVTNQVVANTTDATKIQTGKKKGWCYIGTDRDHRSCLKVNNNDICVSKEVYDSQQQCEHPELRQ